MKSKRRLVNSLTGSATLHAVLVMSFAAIPASITMGADVYWDGSDSNAWATGTNWVTNAAPGAADKAFINNITVNTPAVTADTTISELLVGFAGTTGAVNINSGTVTVNAWAVIGNGNAGSGTLNLAGSGSLNKTNSNASSNFFIGEGAGSTGVVNIETTGSFTSAREVVVGYNSGKGTLNLKAGTMTVNQVFRVGSTGTGSNGTVNQTGGTLALNNAVRIGATTNAITDFNIGAGTSTNVSSAGTVRIGEGAGSTNTVDIDGTLNMLSTSGEGSLRIGHNSNTTTATNTVTVNTGGLLYSEGDMIHGYAGNTGSLNTLNINGGTVKVASTATRWLKIGNWDGQSSVTNITNGGTLKLNTNTNIKMGFETSVSGSHTINVDGGSIIGYVDNGTSTANASATIDMSYRSNAMSAALNIKNGGLVQVRAIFSNNNNTSAVINFDNGTLRATGDDLNLIRLNGTGTREVNLLAGGGTIDSNGYNVTIGNGFSGVGSLTKTGAGTLTLPATNTYTGSTLVNGGTLLLSGSTSSSGLTINGSGAKVTQTTLTSPTLPVTVTNGTYESSAQIKSLTVANSPTNTITVGAVPAYSMIIDNSLTFQGAATLNLRANGSVMDQAIDGSTSMALTTPGDGAANGQVAINVNNIGAWSGGTDYPLIRYSSFTGDISDFTLGTISGLSPRQTPSLVVSDNSIALRITGDSLRWTGATSADWTTAAIGAPYNWILPSSSAGTDFLTGDVVIFDDNAGSNTNVNVAQNVTPGSTLFDNSVDYTISSTGAFGIAGGSVIKNNSGKVTISTNNTYTGTTTINGGTLEISGTGSIATSSVITNNSNLVFNLSGGPNVYANPIAGTGAVTKLGAGTLTLSGASTFTGNFILDAGQLNLNSAGALGAGPGTITINGGTLDNTSGATVFMAPNKAQTWNADITFTGTNPLYMSNGEVTLPATRTVNVQAGTFGCGAVNDSGSGYDLVKTGPGTLVLNGSNGAFSGNIDIQSGIVSTSQDLLAAAPVGTGILQNSGAVGTKWTFWKGDSNVTSNVLIRNNDGTNTRQLGIVKRGSGTLTLTNNSNNATANLSVDSGKLVLNNTGTYGAKNDDGSTVTNLTSVVGYNAASNGVLEINGATVNYNNRSAAGTEVWRSTLNVGNSGTGAGALKLNSGILTLDKQLALGITGNAFGAMTQTGGSATIGGFLALGLGTSQGVFNQTGGTFTLTTGPVTNGAGAGSVGIINLGGTAVYNHNSAANNAIWLGENGTGILNVSGSAALNVANNGVELGKNNVATANGILNLLGGNVTAKYVSKPGAAATGTLNFNGGTLTANGASTTYLTGLTNAFVHSGGGTVNNGGNAITIGQALLAPTGNGVSASGLTVSGGGYIDTPLVTITGDGTGATAVANIDASGNLTGITITNPGTGYTTAPTFALTGGGVGNTGAISGAATLVPNTSGGMTFGGAALTTLSGVNTYTGNSTVNSGTTLVLASGAALKFAPGANNVSNKVTGTGTAAFYGSFNIDTTNAAVANNNSWTLVDLTGKTYDTLLFNVPGFTEDEVENTWTKVEGDNTWVFDEDTGVLTLSVAAPAGYDSWVGGFGLGAGDQDPTDDPDGDGFNNLMEYALGGNPNSSDTSIAPSGTKSGNDFILTFKRNDLALAGADVAITLEYGNDLSVWGAPVAVPATSGTVGDVTFTITDGSPNDTVVATIPNAAATKFFARVKAVK